MKIISLNRSLPVALVLVVFWTVCRLVILWHTGIPQPKVHDEFSYVLGGDTFAHGRLANRPLVLGKFFESPHVLVRPVYISKYPPGQAMFLALGQRLFGSPFYGVLIENALMLFTFCLMLYAWVRPPWALAVSAMFGLCIAPPMYWSTSYRGGSAAASGGALVLLGIGMYRSRPTAFAGAIFALGGLLLVWTRPFEGGVFTIVVLMVFAKQCWKDRRAAVFATALAVMAVGAAWTCYDNRAVTGDPFEFPYVLDQHQYDVVPVLWFLPLAPEPAYSSPRLAALLGAHGWAASFYAPDRPRWQLFGVDSIASLESLGTVLEIALLLTLVIPVGWRDPLFRQFAVVVGIFLLVLSFETFHQPHYAAPVWAALALMIAVWAEHAWNLRAWKQPVGAALVLMVLMLPVIVLSASHLRGTARITPNSTGGDGSKASTLYDQAHQQAPLIARLSALGKRQLVIVRYPSPEWKYWEEWVYNGADIDSQKVVFAHDLGAEEDRALLAYYPDRTAWLLTFDSVTGEAKLGPYPQAATDPAGFENSK